MIVGEALRVMIVGDGDGEVPRHKRYKRCSYRGRAYGFLSGEVLAKWQMEIMVEVLLVSLSLSLPVLL